MSLTHFTSSLLCFFNVRPVDNRDTRIFAVRKSSQKRKKEGLSNASPPDISTCWVPSDRNDVSRLETSSRVSCLRFLLSFQISHMTHLQLHALCGIRITSGNTDIRCVRSVR